MAFYAPLSKKPAFSLPHKDILTVRPLDSSAGSPLPGLFVLALDTPGRVHYLAFHSSSDRADFEANVKAAVFGCDTAAFDEDASSDPRENFVLKSGQWAGVAGSNRSNRRVVLNARRMRFDDADLEAVRAKLGRLGKASAGGTRDGAEASNAGSDVGFNSSLPDDDSPSEDDEGFKTYAVFAEQVRGWWVGEAERSES